MKRTPKKVKKSDKIKCLNFPIYGRQATRIPKSDRNEHWIGSKCTLRSKQNSSANENAAFCQWEQRREFGSAFGSKVYGRWGDACGRRCAHQNTPLLFRPKFWVSFRNWNVSYEAENWYFFMRFFLFSRSRWDLFIDIHFIHTLVIVRSWISKNSVLKVIFSKKSERFSWYLSRILTDFRIFFYLFDLHKFWYIYI